ncbi:MAG: DUF3369 domain-containing protein [Magnetococcales bacterium]|nr:DUF3369 domain-containing protein [Magnetococcales bacterium]
MIIDDDVDVHPVTRLVFKNYRFEGRGLEFVLGYSGADAIHLMQMHPDTAVLFLDVVMETEDAGLRAVRYIREKLENPFVRIVLRTGQPGHAPETEVIAEYDINDYRDKANLSSRNLLTSLTSSLRAYRDIRTIENTRIGLKKIIQATGNLFEVRSLGQLATGILTQLAAIITHEEQSGSNNQAACFAATVKRGNLNIYAAFGFYESCVGRPLSEVVPPEVNDMVRLAKETRKSVFTDNHFLGYFLTRNGMENLIYLKSHRPLGKADQDLIEIFSLNIAAAFENLFLNREIISTQKDVTFALGEVIEARSGEAGQHVRRVAESSRLLAQLAGLPDRDVELIWLAAPMHDLGKIAIPDSILSKPGRLSPEEMDVIRTHTEIGSRVLGNNDRGIIRTGALICEQHHEKWDGTGYPRGLVGEQIHIFARIIGLLDVFDALLHPRVYKPAWSPEQVRQHFEKERGAHFDPHLIDLFLKHFNEFLEIQKAFQE